MVDGNASFAENPEHPVWLFALRKTLARARVWILASMFMVLLALVVSTPWLAWFRELIAHRYAPGSLIRGLDEVFRTDTAARCAGIESSTRSTGAALALVAMLGGAFTAGGWLQVFLERTPGRSLRRFFYGGSRFFFRFLRVLVLTLLALHLAGWLMYGAPWDWLVHGLLFGAPEGNLEVLSSELTARRIGWCQDGLYFASVALILVWGIYTRSRMALQDTTSAVWAGICSSALMIAHPLRTLVPMGALFAAQAVVLVVAGYFTNTTQARLGTPGDWAGVLVLFLLTILCLAWRTMVRAAGYHAALQVNAQLVRPLSRPDPWSKSVGGPGGPRYPVGGDDYEVSL